MQFVHIKCICGENNYNLQTFRNKYLYMQMALALTPFHKASKHLFSLYGILCLNYVK